MDAYELLTTPIDDLYDAGILREPAEERNVKMSTLTFTCCMCGETFTEDYARNNPDRVSRGMYCLTCGTPTMFLSQAIPNTIHYRSRTMSHGSFADDVSAECWLCGATEDLHTITMSNGQ